MWASELQRWLPPQLQPPQEDVWIISKGADIQKYQDAADRQGGTGKRHVCITSYSLFQKLSNITTKYGVIIVDESHFAKDSKAKRTVAVAEVVKALPRAILITGAAGCWLGVDFSAADAFFFSCSFQPSLKISICMFRVHSVYCKFTSTDSQQR